MMDAHRLDTDITGAHPSEAQLLLALDRELDVPDATRVFEHVRTCAACRVTFERFALLSSEVEEYSRAWPPERAVAASTTLPSHRVAAWWQRSWRDRTSSSPAAWMAAAAVLLLIAAGLLLARGSRAPGSNTVGSNAAAPNATASNVVASNAAASNVAAPNAAASNPAAAGSASARAADITLASSNAGASHSPSATDGAAVSPASSALSTIATEMAPMKVRRRPLSAAMARAQVQPTRYWALPNANGTLPLSDGTVVMKVRVSRDQLRLAGIPISDSQNTRDQALVRARVLVGADGVARAIALDQD
jgi:predicted anti-sigma-YlaC factor YlaD